MRLGRIDLNAYDVIDSNSLEPDAGGKVDPLFLIPLYGAGSALYCLLRPTAASKKPKRSVRTAAAR